MNNHVIGKSESRVKSSSSSFLARTVVLAYDSSVRFGRSPRRWRFGFSERNITTLQKLLQGERTPRGDEEETRIINRRLFRETLETARCSDDYRDEIVCDLVRKLLEILCVQILIQHGGKNLFQCHSCRQVSTSKHLTRRTRSDTIEICDELERNCPITHDFLERTLGSSLPLLLFFLSL